MNSESIQLLDRLEIALSNGRGLDHAPTVDLQRRSSRAAEAHRGPADEEISSRFLAHCVYKLLATTPGFDQMMLTPMPNDLTMVSGCALL